MLLQQSEHGPPDPNSSVNMFTLITLLSSSFLEQQGQEQWPGEVVPEREGTAAGTRENGLACGSDQGMVLGTRLGSLLQQKCHGVKEACTAYLRA